MSRSEAAALARAAGWDVRDGVSKGLRWLVSNDPSSSSAKAKKAKQLGVETITERQFAELVSQREEKSSVLNL